MGNIVYTEKELEQQDKIATTLIDAKYPAWVNDKIKKWKERLFWVCKAMQKKDYDKANELLEDIYTKWYLDYEDKHNWIAYDIGSKLNVLMGLPPRTVEYEEE